MRTSRNPLLCAARRLVCLALRNGARQLRSRDRGSLMRLAALDVGSNTVLMLVVECNADEKPRVLADLSRITRLGRGVDASGHFDPDSAVRTLDAIAEFAEKARALGVEKIVGVATAALRDASDGSDFLARVKQRSGITLEV